MFRQILISGAAVAAALALTAPAHASTIYYSGSVTALAPSGITPTVDFTAPGGTEVDVTVTDCCVVGDYYATYVDGALIGTTPIVDPNGTTYSSATFLTTLSAGPDHNFYLVDQLLTDLPAGVSVEIQSVPEPASWLLMLTGVFGLGLTLRSRRMRSLRLHSHLA